MTTILAENLYKAVKSVKRTTPHSFPVLNCALFKVDDGRVTVTTTDLEKPLTDSAVCRQEEPSWSTCVPMINVIKNKVGYNYGAKECKHKYYPFLDYVKVMAESKEVLEVTLDPSTQILTITTGKFSPMKSRTEFKCIDSQEFPPVA